MLINNDGSRYCLESVEEIINERCDREPFPYLSDALGSDWGVCFGFSNSPTVYRANALRAARRSYKPAA